MADLAAAVEQTVAERSARLRLFTVRVGETEWWEHSHASADMAVGRTHVVFRPIPPNATPPPGFSHETEYEYLFDGGRRWAKGPSDHEWHAPQGVPHDPRQISDPLWVLDALHGVITAQEPQAGGDPISARLDLTVAERAVGHSIDFGRRRMALLWRPRLRRWRRAVPARVWVDAGGRLARVEYLDPPWSRLFPTRFWNAIAIEGLGEPVEVPEPPPGASG